MSSEHEVSFYINTLIKGLLVVITEEVQVSDVTSEHYDVGNQAGISVK